MRVRESRSRGGDTSSLKGSTRLEAKKQRRREGREAGRRRPSILTEAEFLARREAVDRVMVVRQRDDRTQIAVLEDNILVEHYVNRSSGASMIGNVYLGRVQNVLPSMEAAFIDVGRGRNAVLYAGEVNWDATGLDGASKRIELALKPGDPVLVQVTKDPVGHKGARLTAQISLPGRFLVFVPNSTMTGISRKLPDNERSRLKSILRAVLPEDAGVIVRTAAEGASEEELRRRAVAVEVALRLRGERRRVGRDVLVLVVLRAQHLELQAAPARRGIAAVPVRGTGLVLRCLRNRGRHCGRGQTERLSAGHAGAEGGRGHYRLRIVSHAFAGLRPIARHQLVYRSLEELMQTDIHALSITALTPVESQSISV